jgi:hypothetical protein
LISPVEALIDKPAGVAAKVPPVVPTNVTLCRPSEPHHGEPEYVIVADFGSVIVIGLVAVTCPQPPAASIVLVTVYVPAVLLIKST